MKLCGVLLAVFGLLLAPGCGSGGQKKNAKKASKARAPQPEESESEPDPPKERRSRQRWYAKAALTPVKGSKLKPLMVNFSQREGDDATVESDALDGARPGTYWLVIHESVRCGANATKAGVPWPGASDTKLRIVVTKDLTEGLETTVVQFDLVGDIGAVDHALVLHEDKKGKPGKAVACGVIEEVEEL